MASVFRSLERHIWLGQANFDRLVCLKTHEPGNYEAEFTSPHNMSLASNC